MSDEAHVLPTFPRWWPLPGGGPSPTNRCVPFSGVYLHEQKLKFTPERAMMLDAVLRKTQLFEPEQLVDDLKSAWPPRQPCDRLSHTEPSPGRWNCKAGLFSTTGQSYYQVIVGRETHDYLICVTTGRVIEFSSERLRQVRDEICREHGFEPLSHQFHIFGMSSEARRSTFDSEATVESANASKAP